MINLQIGDMVRVIGGNNEIDQPTMIGEVGKISSFGTKYMVRRKPTIEVYVDFVCAFETHLFNDYHLIKEVNND